MTMQESPIVKRSSSSLLTEDDDPNGGVFVEENCSGSTSSPENPLFGTFKAQQQEELVSTSSKVVGVVPSTTKAAAAAAATTNASVESSSSSFPDDFHASPEPLLEKTHPPPAGSTTTGGVVPSDDHQHQYHLLRQIREDEVSNEDPDDSYSLQSSSSSEEDPYFQPCFASTQLFYSISKRVFQHEEFAMATWMGFWALLNVTCANYVLSPMRDAVALQVGVHNIPKLTLASSVLAFMSSVPIGWLFEAPDPSRRKVWKKMGLTRGETQGSSLALFFRFFALSLLMYAVGFQLVDWITKHPNNFFAHYWFHHQVEEEEETEQSSSSSLSTLSMIGKAIPYILSQVGNFMYIAFFLVVHLAKLHSISLVWGVTTEAMEYEDVARKQQQEKPKKQTPQPLTEDDYSSSNTKKPKTRLQRLGMVSFGGTLGGIGGRYVHFHCIVLFCDARLDTTII